MFSASVNTLKDILASKLIDRTFPPCVLIKNQGFSLIEVFISLLLLTTTSLALLQQQWRFKQLFNHTLTRSLAAHELDNQVERVLAKQPPAVAKKNLPEALPL